MSLLLKFSYLFLIFSCVNGFTQSDTNYAEVDLNSEEKLCLITNEKFLELGSEVALLNQKGDTIINFGKFLYCQHDTISNFGYVIDKKTKETIGINHKGERIFEAFIYDNGPDYISEGLFRIKRNGKVGYANKQGIIVIKPEYKCASSFYKGYAIVTYSGTIYKDLDGNLRCKKSSKELKIDKEGHVVKN